jgi:hypothetical protein
MPRYFKTCLTKCYMKNEHWYWFVIKIYVFRQKKMRHNNDKKVFIISMCDTCKLS